LLFERGAGAGLRAAADDPDRLRAVALPVAGAAAVDVLQLLGGQVRHARLLVDHHREGDDAEQVLRLRGHLIYF
jgi:hypothetical protein